MMQVEIDLVVSYEDREEEVLASINADDIIRSLNGNDESILAFITEMLVEADSIEIRERLMDRLSDWDGHMLKKEES